MNFSTLQRIDDSIGPLIPVLREGPLHTIMALFSDPRSLVVLVAPALMFLYRSPRRAIRIFLTLALAVSLSDSSTGLVLKPLFPRTRPNGTRLSFPSSHAANTFAGATVVASEGWIVAVPALAVALLVASSRLLLGKHWPTDVIVGVLAGILAGLVALGARRFLERRFERAP